MPFVNGRYVSIFKIDGAPILSPAIDDERRIELNRDKMRAMELERLLCEKCKLKMQEVSIGCNTDQVSAGTVTEKTLVNGFIENSPPNYDTSAAIESLSYDNSANPKQNHINEVGDTTDHSKIENPFMKKYRGLRVDGIQPLSLNVDFMVQSNDFCTPSPNFSLKSSPSLDALNDPKNQSIYFTPMSWRATPSPISNIDITPGRLIRSNSYTLEKPSPMLLQHMQANGMSISKTNSPFKTTKSTNQLKTNNPINDAMASSTPNRQHKLFNNNENKLENSKVKSKSARTPIMSRKSVSSGKNSSATINSQKGSNSNRTQIQNVSFRNTETILQSIYSPATKLQSFKSQLNQSSLKSVVDTVKNKSKVVHTPPISSQNSSVKGDPKSDIMKIMEEKFAARMDAMIKLHEVEQQRMQQKFLQQQEELLKLVIAMEVKQNVNNPSLNDSVIQNLRNALNSSRSVDGIGINNGSGNISGSGSGSDPSNGSDSVNNNNNIHTETPVSFDSNGNRVTRFTPNGTKCVRRLYYNDHKTVSSDPPNITHPMNDSMKPSLYTAEEIKAASTIAAHTRGYLIRRLFSTHKITNIVKTIRDTLRFIINLQNEDNANETAADIEFKTNLVQQLTSASYNLHNIFVEMSTADRMDIIAKDREWKKFKLSRSKSESSNGKYSHTVANGGGSKFVGSKSARI